MNGSDVGRKPKVSAVFGLGWGGEMLLAGTPESTTKAQLGVERQTGLQEGSPGGEGAVGVRRVRECWGTDPAPLPPRRGTDGAADVGRC